MKYQHVSFLCPLNDSNFVQCNIPLAKPHMRFRQNAVTAKGKIYIGIVIPLSIILIGSV